MKFREKLNEWKEELAVIGLIVSLAIVGYEINQNTKAAKAEARSELAALNQEWLMLLGTDTKVRETSRAPGGAANTASADHTRLRDA